MRIILLLSNFVVIERVVHFFLFSPLDGDSRVHKKPLRGGQLRAAGFSACTPAAKKITFY